MIRLQCTGLKGSAACCAKQPSFKRSWREAAKLANSYHRRTLSINMHIDALERSRPDSYMALDGCSFAIAQCFGNLGHNRAIRAARAEQWTRCHRLIIAES